MRKLSLRHKLALLAGIPVIGVVLVSALVVIQAQSEAQRAAALGSVESLAHLSELMSGVVEQLQRERAITALHDGTAADALLEGQEISGQEQLRVRLQRQREETTNALVRLDEFFADRDISKLPVRLANNLSEGRERLRQLSQFRSMANGTARDLDEILTFYSAPAESLIRATAALTELSDDGELLRLITSLVSGLELAERASAQHALLNYVFATREFPPGSYRTLVRLVSEEETHVGVLKTTSIGADSGLLLRATKSDAARAADDLRRVVLESVEDEITVDPQHWDETQGRRVAELTSLASELNDKVRQVALGKREATQRETGFSLGLVGFVVVSSLVMAWGIARGVTQNVGELQDAARRVGAGQLDTHVRISSGDELGALAHAFNDMMEQLTHAKAALQEQVRLARELEIASSIQRMLLPPKPSHPEFEFAGVMIPADEVGGDFYDVLTDAEHRYLWLTVGDVSNHGLESGLVMLMAQSAFACQFFGDPEAPPDRVFGTVNRTLRENIHRLDDRKYATAQVLCYRGEGRFSCAGGHEWPVVYRAQSSSTELIEAPGPWLGIVDELTDVPTTDLFLHEDDILCLYSDGLTEARNAHGELFDLERFQQALRTAAEQTRDLDQIAQHVIEQARLYCERRDDDWTLLLVRRRAAA